MRGLSKRRDEERGLVRCPSCIDHLLHVVATSVLSEDCLEDGIVCRLSVSVLRLALTDELPELVGPFDVLHLVILSSVDKCRSQAFEDDNHTNLVACPEQVEDGLDLILDHNVDIAVTILQTLQSVALRNLAQ